jgi:hypothetical protein
MRGLGGTVRGSCLCRSGEAFNGSDQPPDRKRTRVVHPRSCASGRVCPPNTSASDAGGKPRGSEFYVPLAVLARARRLQARVRPHEAGPAADRHRHLQPTSAHPRGPDRLTKPMREPRRGSFTSDRASCRPRAGQSTRECAFPASQVASPCESTLRSHVGT